MFQFPRFASSPYVFKRGWPFGRVSPFRYHRITACCQLPDAFRRLPRLSSPSTAKASFVCALLLDPISMKPFLLASLAWNFLAFFILNRFCYLLSSSFMMNWICLMQYTLALLSMRGNFRFPRLDHKARLHLLWSNFTFLKNLLISLRQVIKNLSKHVHSSLLQFGSSTAFLFLALLLFLFSPYSLWWSQSGSNRRHPACKAGALPTELWPHSFPICLSFYLQD